MPLPWKKSKVGRISRFVADLRSPSKHGGSLVVETGFPTSVIDLIVKNRDRLKKKPLTKKKKELASEELEPVTFPSSSTDSSDFSNSDLVSSNHSASPVVSATKINNSNRPPTGKKIPPLVANVVEDVASKGVVWWSRTFMITVKVLFMLILALATKKLVVGITISTFLLLFLEFLVLRVFCHLHPIQCPEALRPRTGLITENVSSSSGICPSSIDEIKLVDIDFDSFGSERRWGIGLTDDYRSCSCSEEIKLVEPGFHMIDKRWSSETDTNLHERRWRSHTGFDLSERRWRTDLSKIDQARCEEIQPSKPDSRLLTRERRWGTDSRDIGNAQTLEVNTRRYGLSEGGQVQKKEIQVVELDSDLTSHGKRRGTRFSEGGQARSREIQFVEPYVGLFSRENRWGFAVSTKRGKNSEKVEQIIQSAELRNHKTSNGKIKPKKLLKKLVPKKFRSSKKAGDHENQTDLSGELFVSWAEEEAITGEGQEQREEEGEPEDEEEQLEEKEEEGEKEVNGSDYVSQMNTNADLIEGNGRRTEDKYRYILTILIVLAGLVQGRFMAIVLTIAWCLLEKSIQTVTRILKIT
ncbi:uncharacterized protein LOC122654046 [Telopea speciosissima]|uniref:uncharacterized protein LOC122654046 n=1 Tax=Telopea speciosissima TaxID=54955 RepID=UPI001CC665A8|nr:uncharacterized protein LOC122654046 [Telopea speciosissima]